jgi:hypothetical protein
MTDELSPEKLSVEAKDTSSSSTKPSLPPKPSGKMVEAANLAKDATSELDHYEEVSEYRIGEGPPPLFLVIAFIFIVIWALFSWIPFFGY